MKGFITPAVLLTVVAGYLGLEGARLLHSETAVAYAAGVIASQSQDGQVAQQNLFGNSDQSGEGADMHEGGEMMEFEGDIFADVPEHMPHDVEATKDGKSSKKSFGKYQG
ncbi:hypothetical protein [Microbulbifer epialgicus]|uniref:Uncharacterized protein n=1 Tax=Microbulbifer epialgicus TaxID=393907 RepID=A0ABV4NXF6_9GAMM